MRDTLEKVATPLRTGATVTPDSLARAEPEPPLSDKEIEKIVTIQLARLEKRLGAQNLHLELSDKARAYLAREGYDPAYGARPLKRVIQQKILDPLSMEILDGRIHEGQTIKADLSGDALSFLVK